jgi:hypothetical protein
VSQLAACNRSIADPPLDLDLEVEEEDHAKGVEPPAYWPSREGSVVVENLTCHYAPQVSFRYSIHLDFADRRVA